MFDSQIRAAEDDYLYGTIEEFFSDKYCGMARLIFVENLGDKLS